MAEKRTRRRQTSQRSARLQRGLSIIPSLFTIGNIFCGYFAIISTLKGSYDNASIAIGVGIILDALDGRVARMTKTTSDFGIELDSLADLLTFGAAPAMLAFAWGLASIVGIEASISRHLNTFGWFTTFAFVICGALRLARFNIHTRKPQEAQGAKRHFVGLPIPAGAAVIASIVHYFKTPIEMVGSAVLWSLLVLMVAFLMISTVRYPSFKEFDVRKPRPRLVFAVAAMAIAFVIFYSEEALLILAVVYVSSGPIAKLAQIVRRFVPSHSTTSETAHGNIKS